MTAKKSSTKANWIDPDEPVEWSDEVWERAQFSIGGKVIRPATGTLTKRGRPPVGEEPKQQVTLRLPRHVIDHFRAGGAGWQTRLGRALEDHVSASGRKQGRSSAVAETRRGYGAGKPPRNGDSCG